MKVADLNFKRKRPAHSRVCGCKAHKWPGARQPSVADVRRAAPEGEVPRHRRRARGRAKPYGLRLWFRRWWCKPERLDFFPQWYATVEAREQARRHYERERIGERERWLRIEEVMR